MAINSDGSVFFDQSKQRWIAELDFGTNPATGNRQRVKRRAPTRAKANEALRELRKERDQALSLHGPRTVAELLQVWFDLQAPETMGDAALSQADWAIRVHLTPTLGRYRVTDLHAEHIEHVLRAKAGDLGRSSLIRIRSVLGQAYDWAIGRRYTTWNPARKAVIPRNPRSPSREPRALTPGEARRLIAGATHHRLGAWITTTLGLGLRPGETSGLTWDDIDLERALIVVHRSLAWTTDGPTLKATKTKTPRTLALPDQVTEALTAHRRRQNEERLLFGHEWPAKWDGLVFRTARGTPLDSANIRRMLRTLTGDAGIEGHLTAYDLRHSATSLFSAAGAIPEELADLLGHKDTRMVFRHYRHPVTPSRRTAADYLDRALGE